MRKVDVEYEGWEQEAIDQLSQETKALFGSNNPLVALAGSKNKEDRHSHVDYSDKEWLHGLYRDHMGEFFYVPDWHNRPFMSLDISGFKMSKGFNLGQFLDFLMGRGIDPSTVTIYTKAPRLIGACEYKKSEPPSPIKLPKYEITNLLTVCRNNKKEQLRIAAEKAEEEERINHEKYKLALIEEARTVGLRLVDENEYD